ncbi:MAG: S8 family serine peptidase, partial [Gammaproteobacteria bacterium]|nr:S8 family serine peptidase [Gammaproteobacteria bacterium]
IAGLSFSVNQAGIEECTYTIDPASRNHEAGGGSGSVTVNASKAQCPNAWSVISNAEWLTVTSADSGSGNGMIDYSVAGNDEPNNRNAALTIAGLSFSIVQAGKEEAEAVLFPTEYAFPDTPVLPSSTRQQRSAQNILDAEYHPGRVIIKFREGAERTRSATKHIDGALIKALGNAELWQVENVEAAIAAQKRHRAGTDIEYIEPDYVVRIHAMPDDPEFSRLYGLHNSGQAGGTADADVDAPEAWDITAGGPAACAVIDTGVDYNHPDLAANMWRNPGEIPDNGIDDDANGFIDDVYGWDFVNEDNDPSDDHGHGTHVAGTIAAAGDNGIGITGVNRSGKIMALKFISANGSGYVSDAIEAVEYAAQMGVQCTNNSWGGGGYSRALYDAINATDDALFIAVAGNGYGRDIDVSPYYPASYDLDNIIGVCSSDFRDRLSYFSNRGRESVDLCAPGSRIFSTLPGNRYGSLSGTSMAAPHVAGAVSLLWSAFPELSAVQIKAQLMAFADRISGLAGISVTGGRLNLHKAIDKVPQAQTFTLSATAELVIGQVQINGSDAAEFEIRNDACSSQTLAQGSECTVEVAFEPVSAGMKFASLDIFSNAPETAKASLRGSAIPVGNASVESSSIEWAEPSAYGMDTGEVDIFAVALPNAEGGLDIYRAKLCPLNDAASLRFELCDFAPATDGGRTEEGVERLGDTTYDAFANTLRIPAISAGGFFINDEGNVSIDNRFFEVDMQAISRPGGGFELEVVEVIPIQ